MSATIENTNETKLITLESGPSQPPAPVRLRKVRHSKIGRLPRLLQDQLCHRLEEGQTATDILNWVNALPEVRELLEREFDGRPITPQNLSDWRMDGYLEWVRIQEAREHVDSLKAQGELLGGKEQNELGNQIARVYAIELFATLRAGLETTRTPLERLEVLHQGLQDIKGLRQWDHATARAVMQRERWEFERLDLADARREKDKAAEAARLEAKREAERLVRQREDIEKWKVMNAALYEDGKDLNDYNSFEELTEAYEELQARKAAKTASGKECQASGLEAEGIVENRGESREIVQNRGNYEASTTELQALEKPQSSDSNDGGIQIPTPINREQAPNIQDPVGQGEGIVKNRKESREIVQNRGESNICHSPLKVQRPRRNRQQPVPT